MTPARKLARLARRTALRILPEPWLERRRPRRREAIYRRAGVVFIHVPRCAGTSIAQALYGGFLGHYSVQHLIEGCAPDVLALPRFSVARNPWDRAVSAFEFARAGHSAGSELVVRMMFPGRYQGPEFKSFAHFVEDFLAHRNVDRLDGVFRRQCYYLRARDGTLAFDHLGRMENLAATQSWLSDTLGRAVTLPALNRTDHGDYRSYYTPGLRDLIASIYRDDIDALGYDF